MLLTGTFEITLADMPITPDGIHQKFEQQGDKNLVPNLCTTVLNIFQGKKF